MKNGRVGRSHKVEYTLELSEMCNHNDSEAKGTLKALLVLPIRLLCPKIYIIMVHQTLNVYRTFRDDPVHILSQGVPMLLTMCTANLLTYETHMVSNIKAKGCEDQALRPPKNLRCMLGTKFHVWGSVLP